MGRIGGLVALAAIALAACGGGISGHLRRQHGAAVWCDERAVTVRDIGNRTYAVEGCGVSGVYICDRQKQCRLDGALLTRPGYERRR